VRDYATQRDTAFAVTAPASVVSGRKILITGQLTRVTGGAGVGTQPVTVQQKDAGTTAWKTLGTELLTADGRVSWSVTPTVNTQVRFVFKGTWADKAATGTAAVA
jgi:hypothetical protein